MPLGKIYGVRGTAIHRPSYGFGLYQVEVRSSSGCFIASKPFISSSRRYKRTPDSARSCLVSSPDQWTRSMYIGSRYQAADNTTSKASCADAARPATIRPTVRTRPRYSVLSKQYIILLCLGIARLKEEGIESRGVRCKHTEENLIRPEQMQASAAAGMIPGEDEWVLDQHRDGMRCASPKASPKNSWELDRLL